MPCEHCGSGMHMTHRCGMMCKHCGSRHHGTKMHSKHHPRRAMGGYYGNIYAKKGHRGKRKRKNTGTIGQSKIGLPNLSRIKY